MKTFGTCTCLSLAIKIIATNLLLLLLAAVLVFCGQQKKISGGKMHSKRLVQVRGVHGDIIKLRGVPKACSTKCGSKEARLLLGMTPPQRWT